MKTAMKAIDVVRFHCDQCNEDIIPVDGVTALWQRGYWWCVKHATVKWVDGEPVVQFPSDGKLVPSTIFVSDDEINKIGE